MTSDDTDTPRGNDEDAEESVSNEGATTPPRDPETGQFLPKDERPDAVLDSPETAATEGEQSEGETSQTAGAESEAPTKERETESEPMVEEQPEPGSTDEPDEHESESTDKERETAAEAPPAESDVAPSTDVSAAETPEAKPDTESPTVEPNSAPPTETTAAEHKRPQTAGTGRAIATPAAGGPGAGSAGETTPRTAFVTNPNGYRRPPSTYLPTHPWLRLPSRPPEYETISR